MTQHNTQFCRNSGDSEVQCGRFFLPHLPDVQHDPDHHLHLLRHQDEKGE